ncbi:DUF431-domain-containing protein [Pluteus cervinus]|uniref:DUF431-domain-containing protein n=1 Tax=Pluteus cervinus TaxID=181527 RepID=A0ACD3ATL5_9AGAR|nr:DUF431-domain-containing protein [Pluteus cervinus]
MTLAYIVEHMEEDDESTKSVPPWVELEYAHMRTLAGQTGEVHFTHLSKSSCDGLLKSPVFQHPSSSEFTQAKSQVAGAFVHQIGVLELMKENGVSISEVCLLDPKAEESLKPEDGKGAFKWFLFGGILGDDPPRDRTSELRVLGFPTRHLGSVQMTTDTAVGVTKLVADDGIRLSDIEYIDFPTIRFNSKESVEMPFRYIQRDTEPLLPPGMKELLHEDLNKSFDF